MTKLDAGSASRQLPVPDHLYTWVDVDRHFNDISVARSWPTWLREVEAYWDGVRFTIDLDVPEEHFWRFLETSLGALTVDPDERRILLDTVNQGSSDRWLAVEVERSAERITAQASPRWSQARTVDARSRVPVVPATRTLDLPVAVFHSYKGGVGRTLHCVATALELSKRGRRVLLVDADLEAPGITWMWQAQALRVDFAFEDFLALLHSSRDNDFVDALSLGARFLANQELEDIIVMPARRRHHRADLPVIEPTDLMTADRNPHLLTDALVRLGEALKVDVVLVDLRAGISELNAPLLLDPRNQRVLVSTVSDQSVRGSKLVLDELADRAALTSRPEDPDPVVLLTQFHRLDHQERVAEVVAMLREAAIGVSSSVGGRERDSDSASAVVDQDSTMYVVASPFNSDFLNLPSAWTAVTELVEQSGLCQVVTPIVELLVKDPGDEPSEGGQDPDTIRRQVAQIARRLVYAEQALEERDFLVTEALTSLAEAHQTDVPIEVVIGAKGSGKTFTYLQICLRSYWSEFVRDVDVPVIVPTNSFPGDLAQVPTVPVIQSLNLEQAVADQLADRRAAIAAELGNGVPANPFELRDLISGQLQNSVDMVTWRRTWLACFARSVGLAATPDDAQEVLTEFARNRRALFVVDGLEDVFQNFTEDQQQQTALRALLTDCAEWLRSLRGRPLGLLAFVRRDLAQSAIVQNFAQFETRYSNYALRWNRDEALRLAAWVCKRGGAMPSLTESDLRRASANQLSDGMVAVWGNKMGGPNSREARSESWFLAALSDFTGQIQARDIMIFFQVAAEGSVGDSRYPGRLLVPAGMRNALPQCSRSKIEAITQENRPVGSLLTRLRTLPETDRKVPFLLENVGLESKDARLLETNGVLFRENDQYWMPEIFRHGLGFSATGRPRILAITNLVRRRSERGL